MIPFTNWFNLGLMWARQIVDIGVRVAAICVLIPVAIWLWYGKAKPLMEKDDDQ